MTHGIFAADLSKLEPDVVVDVSHTESRPIPKFESEGL